MRNSSTAPELQYVSAKLAAWLSFGKVPEPLAA